MTLSQMTTIDIVAANNTFFYLKSDNYITLYYNAIKKVTNIFTVQNILCDFRTNDPYYDVSKQAHES